jgi:hypothetical protein
VFPLRVVPKLSLSRSFAYKNVAGFDVSMHVAHAMEVFDSLDLHKKVILQEI